MAKLFISYAREDAAIAERLAHSLERSGHQVWWDRDLCGGASFSIEIERQLRDCDVVIVLWSTAGLQSAWVRDEAAIGRDAGKLIPVSLGAVQPPIGFRQAHTIAVVGSRARIATEAARKIEQAIDGFPAQRLDAAQHSSQRRAFLASWPARVALAAVAVAVATGAAFFAFGAHESWSNSVAVEAQSPAAAAYATTIASDMAPVLTARTDDASVTEPGSNKSAKAQYHLMVAFAPSGHGADASLALSSRSGHGIIWSKSWSVPDLQAIDLQQQMSLIASEAVLCALEANAGRRTLPPTSLSLYVNGCIGFETSEMPFQELLGLFGKLVKLEPKFGPAWLDYAILLAEQAGNEGSGGGTISESRTRALAAIRQARALNARSGKILAAEAWLVGDRRGGGALALMEKAVATEPDNAMIQTGRSYLLRQVGRMREAVAADERAVELDPLSPHSRAEFIWSLTYNGNFSQAREELAKAERTWPNTPAIRFASFTFNLWYGDPVRADHLLPLVLSESDAELSVFRKVIAARKQATPAASAAALAALREATESSPNNAYQYLLALGLFDRMDDAYAFLQQRRFTPFMDTDALFLPEFAKLRANPRFMQIAAERGLVRDWRSTGKWPDFCSGERLTYDCKVEAAKYK